MKLNIGENIKKLRLDRGITQEKLAEALNVSCQSVSRWELDVCYPDIELLPAIANYFDVTLDVLMGMNGIRSEARRNAIFTEAIDHERQGDWPAAIDVLKNALKTYPGDEGMQGELALALSHTGNIKDLIEAIDISEHLLEKSTDEKLRSTVRANLCFLYKSTDQIEKALALGKTLPHIWESREILLPDLVPDDEREAMLNRSLNIASQVLKDVVGGKEISFSLGYKPENDVNTGELRNALC